MLPVSAGSTPVTRLKNVVLPAPFGPISAWMSPGRDARAHVVERVEAAEALGQPFDREADAGCVSHLAALLRAGDSRRSESRVNSPSGRTIIMTISTMP